MCVVCMREGYGSDVLIEPWKPQWASLVSHLPPCSALSLMSARTIVQGKSGHIVLIAIKLKQKGRDTNTETHLASGEITIFYFAFWEGQKVMTGIWPLITSLMLLCAVFFRWGGANLIKYNWISLLTWPVKRCLWDGWCVGRWRTNKDASFVPQRKVSIC